jgi:hypothetical protein
MLLQRISASRCHSICCRSRWCSATDSSKHWHRYRSKRNQDRSTYPNRRRRLLPDGSFGPRESCKGCPHPQTRRGPSQRLGVRCRWLSGPCVAASDWPRCETIHQKVYSFIFSLRALAPFTGQRDYFIYSRGYICCYHTIFADEKRYRRLEYPVLLG